MEVLSLINDFLTPREEEGTGASAWQISILDNVVALCQVQSISSISQVGITLRIITSQPVVYAQAFGNGTSIPLASLSPLVTIYSNQG